MKTILTIILLSFCILGYGQRSAGRKTTRQAARQAWIGDVNKTPDTTDPVVTAFSIPSNSTTLIVTVTGFSATDNIGVTGYKITENSNAPTLTSPGWSLSPPANYTFTTEGTKTLYAWAKDAAGNVSASLSAQVIIDSTPAAVVYVTNEEGTLYITEEDYTTIKIIEQ